MKLPFQKEVFSKYGAPMGRHSDPLPNFEGREAKVYHVPFVDGDYDEGGAYWGGPPSSPLYCVVTCDDGEELVHYTRAEHKQIVIAELQDYGSLVT